MRSFPVGQPAVRSRRFLPRWAVLDPTGINCPGTREIPGTGDRSGFPRLPGQAAEPSRRTFQPGRQRQCPAGRLRCATPLTGPRRPAMPRCSAPTRPIPEPPGDTGCRCRIETIRTRHVLHLPGILLSGALLGLRFLRRAGQCINLRICRPVVHRAAGPHGAGHLRGDWSPGRSRTARNARMRRTAFACPTRQTRSMSGW